MTKVSRPNWKNSEHLSSATTAAGSLAREILGTGTRSIVFQSHNPGRALKLTTDDLGYNFLDELKYKSIPHLPKVFETHGLLGTLPNGNKLYGIEIELLQNQAKNAYFAREIRKVWLKQLSTNPEILSIDPVSLIGTELSSFSEAFEFIKDFTQRTGACFDGDVKSNTLFRTDGTPILVDPVLDLSKS